MVLVFACSINEFGTNGLQSPFALLIQHSINGSRLYESILCESRQCHTPSIYCTVPPGGVPARGNPAMGTRWGRKSCMSGPAYAARPDACQKSPPHDSRPGDRIKVVQNRHIASLLLRIRRLGTQPWPSPLVNYLAPRTQAVVDQQTILPQPSHAGSSSNSLQSRDFSGTSTFDPVTTVGILRPGQWCRKGEWNA